MTNELVIIQPNDQLHPIQTTSEPRIAFDELTALTLKTVSTSSARIYAQTFKSWVTWCAANNADPINLRPAAALAFVTGQDTSKSTRQRQLTALRQLARMAFVLTGDEQDRRIMEALKMVKIGADQSSGSTRTKRALSPADADRVMRIWSGGSLLALRNRAILTLLALTGMRRAEAAALQWGDVDFQNGVVHIRHGKGDKERTAPIIGDSALDALRGWQMAQPSDRAYVFCPVRKGDKLGDDKPIDGKDIYRVLQSTANAAGVEFHPHDLRRTFITDALSNGTPIHVIQAAVGHANAATTLRYAQAVSAREARKTIRLRYGD